MAQPVGRRLQFISLLNSCIYGARWAVGPSPSWFWFFPLPQGFLKTQDFYFSDPLDFSVRFFFFSSMSAKPVGGIFIKTVYWNNPQDLKLPTKIKVKKRHVKGFLLDIESSSAKQCLSGHSSAALMPHSQSVGCANLVLAESWEHGKVTQGLT